MGEQHAYFSPRAIKANEEAIRKSFAARPNDDAMDLCRCRMGQRIGPAIVRAQLDEINRGTPTEVCVPTLLSLLGWALAGAVASVADESERMMALGRYLAVIQMEAFEFAPVNKIVDPGKEAHGEVVGGHA